MGRVMHIPSFLHMKFKALPKIGTVGGPTILAAAEYKCRLFQWYETIKTTNTQKQKNNKDNVILKKIKI